MADITKCRFENGTNWLMSLICSKTHHDGPLPVLGLREDQGAGGVEHLVIHLLLFTRETVQEGPVWIGHTSCLVWVKPQQEDGYKPLIKVGAVGFLFGVS